MLSASDTRAPAARGRDDDRGTPLPEAGATTALVDIKDVTLTYKGVSGGVLALQDTTLAVRRGEFAAVVGPSGCGKSSLMKLVTGLVPPDTGEIVIFGDRVRGPVKIAGMAFQNPNLLPWRKVIDNVLLPLEIVEPHRRRFRKLKRPSIASRRGRCSRPSASTGSATATRGSSPAACSSAFPCAAPSSTSRRC